MQITRRLLLGAAAMGAAALILPRRIWAQTSLTLGDLQIDTLSDGTLSLPLSFATGSGEHAEAIRAILAERGLTGDTVTPPCNLTLLRQGDRVVLFDAGSGHDFMPTAGKMLEALETIGVSVDQITDVIFTHGHPDHLWGLLDEFDEPLFPNAALHMGQAEFDYWMDPETVNTISPDRQTFAAGARRRLEVVAEEINLFNDKDSVVQNVVAQATHGHSPGHMSFVIGTGDQAVMVVGDAIGNDHVAFLHPDWPAEADQDAEMGRATRTALLAQLAESGMAMIGFHLSDGGIGTVQRAGDAYIFNPKI